VRGPQSAASSYVLPGAMLGQAHAAHVLWRLQTLNRECGFVSRAVRAGAGYVDLRRLPKAMMAHAHSEHGPGYVDLRRLPKAMMAHAHSEHGPPSPKHTKAARRTVSCPGH
jgi:hypothetical protein